MDILNGNVRKVYLRYLAAAFGSTLISSIYGIVDMAMVGQYHGPDGSAALAVFAPFWNIIYSFGLLAGIGGSVLFSNIRGQGEGNIRKSNEYFTAAMIFGGLLTAIAWLAILLFHDPLLRLFGADEQLLPLAQRYLGPIQWTVPFFIFTQILAAFLRNDGAPGLATAAVLAGGVFNVFGDWFFVFALDMGISGAGLATGIGAVISLLVTLPHFLTRKNTLRLVMPGSFIRKMLRILLTGFPTCITDIAMGILTVLFNRQIMTRLGADALAVYGIIVNISTFVQCCAYSVGQAAQPIFSLNYGARKPQRIRQCLACALYTCAAFGLFWTGLSLAVPNLYVHIFMTPTPQVLAIAPPIIRAYSLSFLLLPLNVFSTYYFQAVMQPKISFLISVARGFAISGSLILLLPAVAGADSVWYAMLITEVLVAVYVLIQIKRSSKSL